MDDFKEVTGVKYAAQRKYDKENSRQISLKLNRKTDKLMLEWLDKQRGMQTSIKTAIMRGASMEMFEIIREWIIEERYVSEAKETMWGGAGAIISNDIPDYVKEGNRDVYHQTVNAAAFIWLIECVKPLLRVDYMSKFQFYGELMGTIKKAEETTDSLKDAMLMTLAWVIEVNNAL